MLLVGNLNDYLFDILSEIEASEHTKAYVSNTLSHYQASLNYADRSLTLLYAEARDFETFQNVADWILTCEIFFPEHLNGASKDYYTSLAQMSYYRCYRISNRQIKFYEELAERFPILTRETKNLIRRA